MKDLIFKLKYKFLERLSLSKCFPNCAYTVKRCDTLYSYAATSRSVHSVYCANVCRIPIVIVYVICFSVFHIVKDYYGKKFVAIKRIME